MSIILADSPSVNTPTHSPSLELRKRLLVESNGRCWYCGDDLTPEEATIDHKIPRSRGGGGGDNLVAACRACNCAKGTRTVDELRLGIARWYFGEPRFTDEQRRWLREQGFEFPDYPLCVFHGESL